jgi:hypothetical protein
MQCHNIINLKHALPLIQKEIAAPSPLSVGECVHVITKISGKGKLIGII